MKDDLKKQGYSKEDEYFYQKDRERIAILREQAEEKRAKLVLENKKKEYWMRCPKCGSSLKEEEYAGIVLVDRCSSKDCGGIFFDEGELEILMKAKTPLPRGSSGANVLQRSVAVVDGPQVALRHSGDHRLPLQNNFPKRNLISITRH